jgi:hypothetical protein
VKRARFYVGVNGSERELFSSRDIPTQHTTPQYGGVIGPFRTKAGAVYMRDNPLCESVYDAERIVKRVDTSK